MRQLIQVSYSIADEQTKKRECTALKTAAEELGEDLLCAVLTMDRSETIQWQGMTIEVVNVIDWLLRYDDVS